MANDIDLDELAAELAEFSPPEERDGRSPREERIIAGFEDVQRFYEQHGRAPQHGEERDIFERLYAVRLDQLRSLEECRALLAPLDRQRLLAGAEDAAVAHTDLMDVDELMAELEGVGGEDDITELRHVRTVADKRAAEEIANRTPCADFDKFKPVFESVRADLKSGVRETRRFGQNGEIKQGDLFILGGQIAFAAGLGDVLEDYDRTNRRVRLIFDNGTQSDMLLRSLQRALYKDEGGRRITDPSAGPLFADEAEDEDLASGTIYVLRSKSDHPVVAQNRDVLHKIGVTGGDVEKRVANAKLDPTFLLADVEVVATYQLFNVNRTKLENIIHRVFDATRLDIEIKDRFGNPVVPREWFLVPLFAIDEAVERIKDGSITNYIYDPGTARLRLR